MFRKSAYNLILILSLILIIFYSLINCANAQWVRQYPYSLYLQLNDVEFINLNTGWVCGGDGIILKTTNMGTNWTIQNQPALNKSLYSIHPVDSNVVYCVGWFETVLKTTDGGNNWFALKNGPLGQGYSYESVYFINALTGWYGGFGNHIYKTTNGGITFDSVYVLGEFMDMHFKDINTGLVTGGGGEIFKTTNSGINWNRIYLTGDGFGDIEKLSVINNQYCFFIDGNGKRIFKSSNYGDTWDSIGYVANAHVPYCCRFSSLQTGWVGGDYGNIFKSTNGGASWNLQNSGTQGGYASFWFYNDNTGWAVGGTGNIVFTTNGGTTFVKKNEKNIPNKFLLYQNYPNPFNPNTIIRYSLLNDSKVRLKVYNILGKEIETLVNGKQNAGNYEIKFPDNPNIYNQLSNGIYFYSLFVNDKLIDTKKMMIIR
jgi:photosystem II stability/assembly factor-like uncharacterized protein